MKIIRTDRRKEKKERGLTIVRDYKEIKLHHAEDAEDLKKTLTYETKRLHDSLA